MVHTGFRQLRTKEIQSLGVRVEEYEHINDDPHDGWWLRPEYQDSEDGDQRQESN